MGDANESNRTSREMEHLSLQSNRFSRDLLQRFMASNQRQPEVVEAAATTTSKEEEIELNLGLSLGGRFGVDKSEKKRLVRSSSIAGFLPVVRDDETASFRPPAASHPTLIRTSSLPVETEEEWRKRKELQTLRRMEAKRRRSEKQRSKESGGGSSSGCFEDEKREIEANLRGKFEVGSNRVCGPAAMMANFKFPNWAAASARQTATVVAGAGGGGGGEYAQPSSQGSMGSQGGSSSGMSELESKHLQGITLSCIIFNSLFVY